MSRHTLGILALVMALAILTPAAESQTKKSAPLKINWSSSVAISPTLQPDPTRGSQSNDVAVNASGLAIAAWDQFHYTANGPYTIGVAVQTAGRWSAPFTISETAGFATTPRVAAGADGTLAVSWLWEDAAFTNKKVEIAVKAANASTWTTAVLAQSTLGGVSSIESVPVSIDAQGNVTAVWTLWDGSQNVVQTATLKTGSAWSAATTVSGGDDGASPSLAVNARGDASIVYALSSYSAYAIGTSAKFVSRSGPSGTWSAPITISETIPSTAGYVQVPQVAIDAQGLSTVIYSGYGIEAVRQTAANTWTAPHTVLQAPNSVSSYVSIDLGLDQNGNAVVASSIFDATINVDRASVWVTVGSPVGSWSAQTRLTDPAVPVDAYATRVAVSPDGNLALVGWIDHYHGVVQVSALSAGKWGSATTIGRGTASASFQEALALDAGSQSAARAIWKSSKNGLHIEASSYGQ